MLLALGFVRINQNDAIGALGDGIIIGRLYTGGVITVLAHSWNIADINHTEYRRNLKELISIKKQLSNQPIPKSIIMQTITIINLKK